MKYFLLIFCLVFGELIYSQQEPFMNLDKITINEDFKALIKFDPQVSIVINKKLKDLDKQDPLYIDIDETQNDVKLIETSIDKSSKNKYIVVFEYGPSSDPAFLFYKKDKYDKPIFSIPGLQLFLTGNGFIYVAGHTNNYFDQRKKFKFINDSLMEIKQPFNYVGLNTKTRVALTLYDNLNKSNIIANIPANYPIEVLLADTEYNYLIKTDFGLVGWVIFEYIGQKDEYIEGLFFNGD
jgi:hypothetical protein